MACLAAYTPGQVLAATVVLALLLAPTYARTTDAGTEEAPMDCSIVTTLVSSCSIYITYGIPDPALGSPCCDAVTSLGSISAGPESGQGDRRSACACLMSLISTYTPNATAVARLPGLCGVSLGFTIEPNTDCESIP